MFDMGYVLEIGGISISIGTLLLVLAPLVILDFVLIIAAVLSIARKPLPWNQKWVWLLVALLVNIIGPIIYFAVGSNMLEEKAAQLEDTRGF